MEGIMWLDPGTWPARWARGRRARPNHRPAAHPTRSYRSFAFASSTVCHCMFSGVSGPPHARGIMWSTTYPGRPPG
jgi:hypothetical protein